MAAKDDRGRAGEDRAARHLVGRGCRILERNWRCRIGEIDIVAADARVLMIVEVKTRRSTAFGHPFEAISSRKIARLWRLAGEWARVNPTLARGRRIRVDAIGITGDDVDRGVLEHLQDLR